MQRIREPHRRTRKINKWGCGVVWGWWGVGVAVARRAGGGCIYIYIMNARARCMWRANAQAYGRNNTGVTASRNPKNSLMLDEKTLAFERKKYIMETR